VIPVYVPARTLSINATAVTAVAVTAAAVTAVAVTAVAVTAATATGDDDNDHDADILYYIFIVFTSFERGISEFEGHGGHLLRWVYLRVPPLRRPLRLVMGSRLVKYSQCPDVLKVVNINPLLRVGGVEWFCDYDVVWCGVVCSVVKCCDVIMCCGVM
jgi:hypothetical protein